ncbi:MAG: GNAT family N-acetyltransferase [Thermoplasmata archaeon]|nr:MAG: GNAT family N-acetyltransferase [Thermoplasmata archaeon]
MMYDPDRLVKPIARDPKTFRPVDLPGGDLPAMVKWAIDEEEVEHAFDIRREVFVVEQGYTEEQEFDEAEPLALHVLAQLIPGCATTPGAARHLGAARLLLDSSEDPPIAYVSRLSVLKFARRMGLGKAIVEFVLDGAKEMGCIKARAGSQKTALDFWGRLGFRPTGEEYMDFHVPHEWTERRL